MKKKELILDGSWAVRFINNLTLCGGYSGTKMQLRPWQDEVIEAIFKRKNALENQYKRVFCMWARGQAKTQLMASVVIAKLLGDPRHGQSIYSAAKTQKQSALIFERIAQIIRQDEYLSDLCEISDFKKRVDVRSKFSFFQALTHDTSGGAVHGLDPSCLVFDELHALGHKRDYYSALTTSMGKRKDQQMIVITTAGDTGSICEEEFNYAKKVVADPEYDPNYYASLHYLEKDAECLCEDKSHDEAWLCPQQWQRVNPALNDFKEEEAMEQMARQAEDNPAVAHEFKKFHLNMFQHDLEALIPMEHYKECKKKPLHKDDLIGEPMWCGFDIGAISDWTVLTGIFKKDDGIKVLSWYWIPEDTLQEQQHRTKKPVLEWVNRGWVRTTEGNVTDFGKVRRDVNEIADLYKIQMVAADPYNATQLCMEIEQDGIPMNFFRQGYISMNVPVCELVRQVTSHNLHMGDDPIMEWMCENAMASYDNSGNVKIDRKDRTRKVDGCVALAMAIGVAGLAEERTTSVYEDRGALVF